MQTNGPRFGPDGDLRAHAGEQVAIELAFKDEAGASLPLTGRVFAATIYRQLDRTAVLSVAGVLQADASGSYVRHEFTGEQTTALFVNERGKQLRIEVAEILTTGREVWIDGAVSIRTSAGTIAPVAGGAGSADATRFVYDLPSRRVVISHRGPRGADNYELALAEGFVGTRAQWVESLKPDTSDPAFTGTATAENLNLSGALNVTGQIGTSGNIRATGANAFLSFASDDSAFIQRTDVNGNLNHYTAANHIHRGGRHIFLNAANTAEYASLSSTGLAVTGTLSSSSTGTVGRGLFINKAGNAQGIGFFGAENVNSWSTYVGQAGTTGNGPRGTLTAPTGAFVTQFAIRNLIGSGNGGHGWTWETVADAGTAPTITAELSRDGNFSLKGTFYSNGLSVTGAISASGNINATAGQIVSTRANNVADGAGQIYLNGVTGNRIDYSAVGVAAPTFTSRSPGTKIVLYPILSDTSVDYAFGINAFTLWSSIPKADASHFFRWFAGTTNIATLEGTGNFSVTGSISGAAITANGPVRPGTYTVLGLPAAASHTNATAAVTDGTRPNRPIYSDGTNWRYISDDALVA